MKFIKNNLKVIIAFAVGIILTSSISIYAYSCIANDIKYTKKDGVEISVQDALDELYTNNQSVLNSTLVASNIYTTNQHNPTATAEYVFEEDGLAVVNLGTRSAGNDAGTTSYTIKVDDVAVKQESLSTWGYLISWSQNITAGQKVSVNVSNTASNAAAFAFINFIKK